MKKFLLLFSFLLAVFSFAQNPYLFNKNCKISKIIWNGVEYFPPNVACSDNSYFRDNSSYPNIISSYFNAMSGSFTFNNGNTTFSKSSCGCTLADYMDDNGEVNQFSGMNCYFFMNQNSTSFSYIINYGTNSDTLIITNSLGDKIFYQYTNLSVQNLQNSNLKIYPNPVSDVIFIENVRTNSLVKIIDVSGKIVLEKKLSGNSIDVKSLSKGIYFIEIEGNKPLKFIKK